MSASWSFPLRASIPAAPDGLPQPGVPGLSRDAMVVVIACAFVGLVLLLFVLGWRKRRRHRHRHSPTHASQAARTHPPSAGEAGPAADPGAAPGTEASPPHRRRRRRRSHRGRNPTLAETGGLPPPRPEGQPPPGL